MTSANIKRYRPVVAIDIDGVLRLAVRPGQPAPEGAYPVQLTLRRGAYPALFHRPPDWDSAGTATGTYWLSGIGATWVRSLLSRGIEVVWATTWQEYANVYFAEPLGIPPLPLGVSGGVAEEFPDSPEWKTLNLARRYPGRPLVWVDDNPVSLDSLDLSEVRPARDRALTRSFWITNPSRGITAADVTELDAWVELASSPVGHETLRRLRRNQRRRTERLVARSQHGTLARAARWKRAFKIAVARVEPHQRYIATALANGVRDSAFDRDSFRNDIKRWTGEPITPDLERLLGAIEDHVRAKRW